jgi:uncharacterized protein YaaW (UPF0174 family)
MNNDPIFQHLPESALEQIATYLSWDPLVSVMPAKHLSETDQVEKLAWLNQHRSDLEERLSWVGTPVFSYAIGNRKSYREIVVDLAEQLKTKFSDSDATAEVERNIVEKVWSDALSRLSPEQRKELLSRANTLAKKHGMTLTREAGTLAALSAAQMSGFGIYIFGSTLLGAINSALGLGLGFGVFTGLSSLISLAIGPIGWASVGLVTIHKLGAPNYKKLLPVVALIAAERAVASVQKPPVEGRTDLSNTQSPQRAQIPQDARVDDSGIGELRKLVEPVATPVQGTIQTEENKSAIKKVTDEFIRSEAKKIKPAVQPLAPLFRVLTQGAMQRAEAYRAQHSSRTAPQAAKSFSQDTHLFQRGRGICPLPELSPWRRDLCWSLQNSFGQ